MRIAHCLALVLPLVATLAGGCGGDDAADDPTDAGADAGSPDSGGPVDMGQPDSGVAVDTGTPDTGPRDCSNNPFNCRPMQLLDDQCRCLPECEGDFVWNPATSMCEPPVAGECRQDVDCPGPDDVCLNPPVGAGGSFAPCQGEDTCECYTGCNPFEIPARDCPAGQACAHLITPGLGADAVCVAPGMGGIQNESCSDIRPCNRNTNHFCIGAMANPTGVCQRLCDQNDPGFCASLAPDLVCNDAGVEEFPDLGLCGPAPVPTTDFGQMCTANDQCGGLCSEILGGCSAACGGGLSCGPGAACITFSGGTIPPGEESLCFLECTSPDAVGDAECSARNPAWVCRDLVMGLSPLCSPGCTRIGCPSSRPTCNPATGRCE